MSLNRRHFLQIAASSAAHAAASAAHAASSAAPSPPATTPFEYEEAGISDLQQAIHTGRTTAVSLAQAYLQRIEEIDRRGPMLRSVIELNPDALAIARALDEERREKGPRSPLHGIPILIKDNIDTHDKMSTTAGSLALLGSTPPRDAFLVTRLRAAGALILGKTNLSEWANFRNSPSSSGWSARGGQTKNPYILDRNPSGSSSGSAVAVSANLCAAAIGTETDGSIISPSAACGIVGLKPTVGLISRSGIIPISHTQDTAGPMARTVRDLAILLSALAGPPDPRDPATVSAAHHLQTDYTRFLDPAGLKGARLGVARRFFRSGALPEKLWQSTLDTLRQLGATLIDPCDDAPLWRFGDNEFKVMLYEFKAGLNAYLATLAPTAANPAPIRSLQDLIDFNLKNANRQLQYFGQSILLAAQSKGPLTDKEYTDALEICRRLSRAEGIDAVMDKHNLDAIIAPSGGPAGATDLLYGNRGIGGSSSPAAVAGYPNITLPIGQIHHLPTGLSFFGRPWSEPTLLKLAYALEQATKPRTPPRFLPTLA